MFAYITDIYGNFSNLRQFAEQCKSRLPELRYLLLGGDLTRQATLSEDWAAAKNASISEACQLFRELNLETYFILGNDDIENPAPVNFTGQNFLGMTADVLSLGDGVGLLGFSYVTRTPFFTRYEGEEITLRI